MDQYLRAKPCSSRRSGALTQVIVDMIALDLRPINIVNGIGFQRLLRVADSSYALPFATRITSLLRKKWDEGKRCLKGLIADACGMALTTDLWTSNATESYVTVTSHHIDDNWNMLSLVLETSRFSKHHTAENIGRELVRVAENEQIVELISAVTHNEAANMVAAMRVALESAVVQHELQSHQWQSVVCAAHRLQTCIRYALEVDEVTSTISCARKLVGHFRHSAKATMALMKEQKERNNPERKLIQDVSTRWNSTYYMLDRLINQHMPVVAVLNDKSVSKKGDPSLDLTPHQWILAEDLVSTLKPFESATRLLSSEKNVLISAVLTIIYGLWKGVIVNTKDSKPIKAMRRILLLS